MCLLVFLRDPEGLPNGVLLQRPRTRSRRAHSSSSTGTVDDCVVDKASRGGTGVCVDGVVAGGFRGASSALAALGGSTDNFAFRLSGASAGARGR